jgi:histidyl-tRNA synthetase
MAKNKSSESDFIAWFDRLPERERVFTKIKDVFRTLAAFYGFEAISPSIIEETRAILPLQRAGVFERPLAACKISSGADFILRPSGALGILRAYTRHKMNDLPHPLKFLFMGEAFSGVKGSDNLRSFYEGSLCMVGEDGPIAEAEIIQIIWKLLEKVGMDLSRLNVRLNATACNECRVSFRVPYLAYLRPRAHRLCKTCKHDFKKNQTKVLVCQEDSCKQMTQNAPQVLDYICEVCKRHLRGVLEFLDEIKIPYTLDSKFFKDGTLYGSLVFDIVLNPVNVLEEGGGTPGPKVLAEGGRMSRVGEILIGRRLDVASASFDLNTLADILTQSSAFDPEKPKVYLAQLGDLAKRKSLELLEALRAGGISVYESLGRDSVKSQLNVAERIGAQMALILGQKEALDNTIIVREIQSGIQETIAQEKLVEFLKRKLKK